MSLSLEPDVYEEPMEWFGPLSPLPFSYVTTNYNVVKIKVIAHINSVKDNTFIHLSTINIPIKLLICLVKKSKYGIVSFDGKYYTIIFSTKLFGIEYITMFYYWGV